MPNHVTTICTITGSPSDVDRFEATHMPDGKLDFDTIVPSPECLKGITSGSDTDIGMAALVGTILPVNFRMWGMLPEEILSQPGFYQGKLVRAWVEKNRPEAIGMGRRALAAIAETGYPTWYEWNTANWGTKWGAYSQVVRSREPGRLVMKFETAWNFPEPIFRVLAEKFPEVTFAVLSHDEGGFFGCDGEFNGRNDFRQVKELGGDDQYERVHGEPRDREKEDEGSESESSATTGGDGNG